jgi:hypothetical protein
LVTLFYGWSRGAAVCLLVDHAPDTAADAGVKVLAEQAPASYSASDALVVEEIDLPL